MRTLESCKTSTHTLAAPQLEGWLVICVTFVFLLPLMSKRARGEDGTDVNDIRLPAWAANLPRGTYPFSAAELKQFINNLRALGYIVTRRPDYCSCDAFRPALAVGRDYEQQLACENCGHRCSCCDRLFTSAYEGHGRHIDDDVCCACAHRDSPCECVSSVSVESKQSSAESADESS